MAKREVSRPSLKNIRRLQLSMVIGYANNRTVGKISNATSSLMGDSMYDGLSSMITRMLTHDGWSAGFNDACNLVLYDKATAEEAAQQLYEDYAEDFDVS